MMASEALRQAARAVLGTLEVGVHDMNPVQAAFPRVEIEPASESDWSHKSGEGREIRIGLVLRDKGERPDRLDGLMAATGEAMAGISDAQGWQVVTMRSVRSRVARDAGGWSAFLEFRARMLREE